MTLPIAMLGTLSLSQDRNISSPLSHSSKTFSEKQNKSFVPDHLESSHYKSEIRIDIVATGFLIKKKKHPGVELKEKEEKNLLEKHL